MSSFSSTSFSTSSFSTNSFSFDSTPAPPSVTLLGGGPGGSKWNKKKHEYFFTPAWQLFEREMQALEDAAVSKEQELHEAQSAHAAPEPRQPAELGQQEQLAAYEEQSRSDIEAREQFLVYEQKMRQEINGLRMRRDRLIRQRNEEEVILAILQGLPPLH